MHASEPNHDVLAAWPQCRDSLVVKLNRLGLSGNDIGEVLKEVEAHTQETGESPEAAFGDPVRYAASRVLDPHPIGWSNPGTRRKLVLVAIGGGLQVLSAMLTGMHMSLPFGINPLIGSLAGTAILLLMIAQTPKGDIRDPQTGAPLMPVNNRKAARFIGWFALLLLIILCIQLAVKLL